MKPIEPSAVSTMRAWSRRWKVALPMVNFGINSPQPDGCRLRAKLRGYVDDAVEPSAPKVVTRLSRAPHRQIALW